MSAIPSTVAASTFAASSLAETVTVGKTATVDESAEVKAVLATADVRVVAVVRGLMHLFQREKMLICSEPTPFRVLV